MTYKWIVNIFCVYNGIWMTWNICKNYGLLHSSFDSTFTGFTESTSWFMPLQWSWAYVKVYTEFLPGAELCQIKLGKDTLSAKKGKRKITLIRKQVSNGRRIRHFGADERSSFVDKKHSLVSFRGTFTFSLLSSDSLLPSQKSNNL